MWVQLLAGALLAFVLFRAFRLAMGLRAGSLEREQARLLEESRGRRVVAELPRDDGRVDLFLEDEAGFYWGDASIAKPELLGARLLLNEGVVSACVRWGGSLPEPGRGDEYEGRERWEVRVYLNDGGVKAVACGRLREGVSRAAGRAVFGAIEATVATAEGGA